MKKKQKNNLRFCTLPAFGGLLTYSHSKSLCFFFKMDTHLNNKRSEILLGFVASRLLRRNVLFWLMHD